VKKTVEQAVVRRRNQSHADARIYSRWPPLINARANAALSPPYEEAIRDQEDLGLRVFYSVQLSFYSKSVSMLGHCD